MVDETPGSTSQPRRAAGSYELALLALVAALTVLVSAALIIRLNDVHSDPAAASRNRATTAGATGAAALLSYDYRSVDRIVATNRALLSAACLAGYTSQVNDALKAEVTKNNVVLSATVRSAAVQALEPTRATILVVLDEKRTGSDRPADQNTQLAVSVSLVREGRAWLVDDLVPAGSEPAATSGAAATSRHCS